MTKTIKEWAIIDGIEILDPDGFDRNDPNLYEKQFTYEEYQKGLIKSTIQSTKKIFKPLKIAIDFDGTCVTHEYPNIGKDIGAVPVLKKLIAEGHKLILNTMRCGPELEAAENWFKENDIPLYGVNEDPGQKEWTQSPKVYANLYIDDAALGCPLYMDFDTMKPHVDWQSIEEYLREGLLISANAPYKGHLRIGLTKIEQLDEFENYFTKEYEWRNQSPDGVSMCRTCKNSCIDFTDEERENFIDLPGDREFVKCLCASEKTEESVFTDVSGYCRLFEKKETK